MAAGSQEFCLRWNNHQSTIVSVFDYLQENETLVDCTLAAEGQYLKAHKVVLCACSPYLELLLSQHNDKHPILIFKDIKFSELKCMIEYMYKGEVNIAQDQLNHFLKAAESLQIKGLSESEEESTQPAAPVPAPRPPPPRAPPIQRTPQVRQSYSNEVAVRPPPDSPSNRADSGSPTPRKRRRQLPPAGRPSLSGDDASNASEGAVENSSVCDPNNGSISTPLQPSSVKNQSNVVAKVETNTELLLEPKTEFDNNSVEAITLDDEEEDVSQAGSSIMDTSQMNFSGWQQLGENSNDEMNYAGASQDVAGDGTQASQDTKSAPSSSSQPKLPEVTVTPTSSASTPTGSAASSSSADNKPFSASASSTLSLSSSSSSSSDRKRNEASIAAAEASASEDTFTNLIYNSVSCVMDENKQTVPMAGAPSALATEQYSDMLKKYGVEILPFFKEPPSPSSNMNVGAFMKKYQKYFSTLSEASILAMATTNAMNPAAGSGGSKLGRPKKNILSTNNVSLEAISNHINVGGGSKHHRHHHLGSVGGGGGDGHQRRKVGRPVGWRKNRDSQNYEQMMPSLPHASSSSPGQPSSSSSSSTVPQIVERRKAGRPKGWRKPKVDSMYASMIGAGGSAHLMKESGGDELVVEVQKKKRGRPRLSETILFDEPTIPVPVDAMVSYIDDGGHFLLPS